MKSSRPAVVMAAGLLVMAPGCQRPSGGGQEARAAAAHWSYGGRTGPRWWGELGPGNSLCGQGEAQSPVDLGPATTGDAGPVALDYRPVDVRAHDTGHTIQWDFDEGASAAVDGVEYALRQVHFHAPAEHTASGSRHPLELHFVHQAADGRLAVLAVFGREGRSHAGLERLLAALREGADEMPRAAISPEELLPSPRAAVRYDGSLTTPPCSESVRWIVLTEPIEVAPEQLDRLRGRYSENYRPLQPLNGRPLLTVARPLGGTP